MDETLSKEAASEENIPPSSPSLIKLLKAGALLLVVLGLTWLLASFFGPYLGARDVVVGGVPYVGNFSGEVIRTPLESIVSMITRYWGDERIAIADIPNTLRIAGLSNLPAVKFSHLEGFFRGQGYETNAVPFENVTDLTTYLEQNIPVVVSLKLPTDDYMLIGSAVLLGIVPSRKVVVMHDNLLGNNFEMTFETFEATWEGRANDRVALVITPSDEITALLSGPRNDSEYPARLGIMDDLAMREVQFKWMYADEAETRGVDAAEVAALWQEIIDDPVFTQFRPTGQMWAYLRLAKAYASQEKIDQAIALVEEQVMPLNHDIEAAYGEWPAFADLPPNSEWIRPWVALGELYAQQGDATKAREAYEYALTIVPDDLYTLERLQEL